MQQQQYQNQQRRQQLQQQQQQQTWHQQQPPQQPQNQQPQCTPCSGLRSASPTSRRSPTARRPSEYQSPRPLSHAAARRTHAPTDPGRQQRTTLHPGHGVATLWATTLRVERAAVATTSRCSPLTPTTTSAARNASTPSLWSTFVDSKLQNNRIRRQPVEYDGDGDGLLYNFASDDFKWRLVTSPEQSAPITAPRVGLVTRARRAATVAACCSPSPPSQVLDSFLGAVAV